MSKKRLGNEKEFVAEFKATTVGRKTAIPSEGNCHKPFGNKVRPVGVEPTTDLPPFFVPPLKLEFIHISHTSPVISLCILMFKFHISSVIRL